MITHSRLSAEPQSIIDSEAHVMAIGAEVFLLRALLNRCGKYLSEVAQEARSDGEPDAYAEGLMRDIRLALSGSSYEDDANLCVK